MRSRTVLGRGIHGGSGLRRSTDTHHFLHAAAAGADRRGAAGCQSPRPAAAASCA